MILGTAAYMSPEQSRGKSVDKRSDIWAFGCVLYEMLTGRRAFDADDVTDVLAFIITKEPDLTQLPAKTPPVIRKLLARCLAKDRKKRLADISDARLEIEDAIANPWTDAQSGTGAASVPASDRRWRLVAPGVLVCCVLTGVAVWSVVRGGETVDRPIQRFAIQVPPSAPILGGSVAVSSDGTRLAYHGRYVDSGHIVYTAPASSASGNLMAIPFDIDRLRATGPPVPVIEGVVLGPPRLSPDGSRVALDIRDDQNDIWVWDLARHSLSMVTKDPGLDRFPVWSADGKRIAYASPRDGTLDSIYIQAADGTGAVQRLTYSSAKAEPQLRPEAC